MAQYKPLFYRGAPASIPQVVAHLQKAMSEEDPDYTPLRQRMPPASIPDIVAHIQKYLTENVFVTMEDLGEDIAQYIEDHPEIVGVATVNGSTGNVILDAGNIPLETGEDPTIAGAISYLSSQLALLVADAVMSVNGVVPDDSHDVTLTGADITQDANTTKKLSETFGPATPSTAGTKGLVPAPQAGDENKVLSGSGAWVDQSTGGGSVSKVCNVSPDSQGNVPLKGSDIPLQSMSLQTVAQAIAAASTVFSGATSQAAGAKGQVPAPAAGEDKHALGGSGAWVTGSGIATSDTDDTPISTSLSSLNDQIANVGTTIDRYGTTNTGTAISRGTFFKLNDNLCLSTLDIAQGATFDSTTNYTQITNGGLNAIRSELFTLTSKGLLVFDNPNFTGSVGMYPNGNVGYINISVTSNVAIGLQWIDIGHFNNLDLSHISIGFMNIEGAIFQLYDKNGIATFRVSTNSGSIAAGYQFRSSFPVMFVDKKAI